MKDAGPVLRAILLGDPAIEAAIKESGEDDRIFPGLVPPGETRVSITYNLITELLDYHMSGSSGLMNNRIQIDCWAPTRVEAVHVAGLVFDRLSGFKAVVEYGSASPKATVDVKGIFHDNGRDDVDNSANPPRFTRRRDYIFWYRL